MRSGIVESNSGNTFSCAVDQLGRTVRITVTGELDMLTAAELDGTCVRLERTFDEVVFDLRGVTFFASAGITALLTTSELCAERGAVMSVKPSRLVARVLAVSGLTDVLAVAPWAGESMGSCSEAAGA
jgi:anti-anti-sigma factor